MKTAGVLSNYKEPFPYGKLEGTRSIWGSEMKIKNNAVKYCMAIYATTVQKAHVADAYLHIPIFLANSLIFQGVRL